LVMEYCDWTKNIERCILELLCIVVVDSRD